ncbi:hypothetical protein HPB52_019502 [Rhipicephalus sanguineus]|uniref:Transmembrane protein n=1 Tax=Rhipicephalus sanguineus TaxID=34632 RepID=A0A9D4PQ77_RHISA|nr:hypothetical protein HPB52_019502 [Rhipicephalus sanguineus]
MASGSRHSPKTINERSAEGNPQREPLENAAPCRSQQWSAGGPFKQRLSFSGRSSGTVSQAALSPSTQGVPKHESVAAHVEIDSTSRPSSQQSSVVGSFRDVRRLSPVYSSEEDRWSPRSMSLLFSQTTLGYEFDQASLSHRVSSLAEERRACADAGPCQRYTMMTFLVAVVVACVTAVVVDMRWTALARNRWTQHLVDPDLPAVASPVEANASVRRTTYLSQTTVARVEPSSSANETAAFYERTTLGSSDDNVTVAPETKHKCGLAFYTYCLTFRHEAYYRHTTRSCVRTLVDDVHVCNHSPNRCAKDIFKAFVGSQRGRDVKASWWVFDGKRCRPWDFPKGRCPSPDESDIFGSLYECVRRCSSPKAIGDNYGQEGCRGPGVGITCDSDLLRFPYFADVSPGAQGPVRCVRASAATLLTHRCLIGSNRFSSDEACKRACVDGATLGSRMKGESAE